MQEIALKTMSEYGSHFCVNLDNAFTDQTTSLKMACEIQGWF